MIEHRNIHDALTPYCDPGVNIQAQEHVKPIHYYTAMRLLLEGGFLPEHLQPRPPFKSQRIRATTYRLEFDAVSATTSEATVLGGLRTKQIDLVVKSEAIGPALGISFKTTNNAFRNIPNRIEELIGDATNIHIRYPAFTYGFMHIIKMVKESDAPSKNDASFTDDGEPLDSIKSFHSVLSKLTGRERISDPPRRYEAVALLIIECTADGPRVHTDYPPSDSPVRFEGFLDNLYEIYDERYCYMSARAEHCRKSWELSNDKATENLQLAGLQDAAGPFPYEVREE